MCSAKDGNLRTAAEMHWRVLSLIAIGVNSDPVVRTVKLAMKKLGVLISPTLRSPALSALVEFEGNEPAMEN